MSDLDGGALLVGHFVANGALQEAVGAALAELLFVGPLHLPVQTAMVADSTRGEEGLGGGGGGNG